MDRPYIVECSKCGVQRARHNRRKFICNNCLPEKYPRVFYKNKKIVLQRDGHTCQCCGDTKNLIVHHIDCDIKNNSPSNLITLCIQCHSHLHKTYSNKELREGNIWKMFPKEITWGKFGKTFRPKVVVREKSVKKKRFFKRSS